MLRTILASRGLAQYTSHSCALHASQPSEVLMRRTTTKTLLPALLLTLGALPLIPSCADNNSSVFVVGVIALDKSTCVAKPDNTATLLAGGTLDVAFTQSYTGFLLVGNQLTQRGSREQLRT